MSENNFTCRNKYYNYGSYLRSRGYDKEICNLITSIEQGQISIGPITPGNCSTGTPTTVLGNFIINPCPNYPNTSGTTPSGQLKVNGGYIGESPGSFDPLNSFNSTTFATQALNFGISSNTGVNILGPIYQQTDCNHSNWFGAANHIFSGGYDLAGGLDCSTNVIIRGSLLVDGSSVSLNTFIGENLTLVTFPGNTKIGTLNLFKSPFSTGNNINIYNDTSNNIVGQPWQNGLSFAIDGDFDNTPNGSLNGISYKAGMTNVNGHVRSFKGLTITNPSHNGIVDISYNPMISGTNIAINAFGSIRVQPGNIDDTGISATGNIDISGGNLLLYQNDVSNIVLFSNGNASFNACVLCYDLSVNNHASIYDLSVVNLASVYDLSVNNHASIYDLSVVNLATFGTSTTIIDTNHIQANSGDFIDLSVNNHASIYDLSVVNLASVYDLSVNNHASIYDLSVVNLATFGTSTTIIDTNHIQANSGDFIDLSVSNIIDFSDNIVIISKDPLGSIAIGNNASNSSQLHNSIAIGNNAGNSSQLQNSIAIGLNAGNSSQLQNSIAIGNSAGNLNQNTQSIAIGLYAGYDNQNTQSIAIGLDAGHKNQQNNSVAIGNQAGFNWQSNSSVAIGKEAGHQDQEMNSVAIGTMAGSNQQGENSVAIGKEAGHQDQGSNSVAIGTNTVCTHNRSVVIGTGATSTANDQITLGTSSETVLIPGFLTVDGIGDFIDLSVNNHASIYDLSVVNLALVYDLSVNHHASIYDLSVVNLALVYDLSVNNHASIYDLSVVNLALVYDLSVNNHASIYDLSVVNLATTIIDTNHIQAINGDFIDLSVNNHASIYDLSVVNLALVYDLSVNNHAFIHDLSVNNSIHFTQNSTITNSSTYNNRNVVCYGETISILSLTITPMISDLYPTINFSNSYINNDLSGTVFSNNGINNLILDLSGSFPLMKNSLLEIYANIDCSSNDAIIDLYLQNTEETIINYDNGTTISIGSLNINMNHRKTNITLGPKIIYLTNNGTNYNKTYKLVIKHIPNFNDITFGTNSQLIIKQKSLV